MTLAAEGWEPTQAPAASWRQGLLPGSQSRLVFPGIPASCSQGAAAASDPLESKGSWANASGGAPTGGTRGFTAKANDSQCHPACPTGLSHVPSCWQGEAAPQSATMVPPAPRCPIPGFEAGREHPCIPWQASREGQQQERLEAAREGRKGRGDRDGEQRSQTCWGCPAL